MIALMRVRPWPVASPSPMDFRHRAFATSRASLGTPASTRHPATLCHPRGISCTTAGPSDPPREATDPLSEVTKPKTQATDPTNEPPNPKHEGPRPDREPTQPAREARRPTSEACLPGLEARLPGLEAWLPELEAYLPTFEACLPRSEAKIRDFSTSLGLQPSLTSRARSLRRGATRLDDGVAKLQSRATRLRAFVTSCFYTESEVT